MIGFQFYYICISSNYFILSSIVVSLESILGTQGTRQVVNKRGLIASKKVGCHVGWNKCAFIFLDIAAVGCHAGYKTRCSMKGALGCSLGSHWVQIPKTLKGHKKCCSVVQKNVRSHVCLVICVTPTTCLFTLVLASRLSKQEQPPLLFVKTQLSRQLVSETEF